MTLTTAHNWIAYTAAGGTVFAYDFLILAASDLKVYVNRVLVAASGYTVSGVGVGSGGNVTFGVAPTSGHVVLLLRDTDATQPANFVEGDRLPSETVEGVFDKVYAALQDTQETAARAFGLPVSRAGSGPVMPDLDDTGVWGKAVKINAEGTGLDVFTVLSTDIISPITSLGDLIQGGTGGVPERLAVGATDALLTVTAGRAAWATLASRLLSVLTVNGDLLYRNGAGAVVRLPIGAASQVLQVSSGLPSWQTQSLTRVTGERVNLVVKHDATNPAFKLTITADALDLEGYRVTSLSVSPDLTSTGANGLDTGAEAANTHYYVWVIAKTSDAAATPAGLFSVSATAPTMPSGYDLKRLVSHRRNDASSNFIRVVQSNDLALGDYEAMPLASAITVTTDLDTSSFVPAAIADMVLIRGMQAGFRWSFDDKDDSSIRYWEFAQSQTSPVSVWVRKNASNLFTATELSGGGDITVHLIGWKIKGL